MTVALSRGSRTTSMYVHRLVMLAFCGPPPKGAEVCHHDDNPVNNALDNLRYDTRSGNCRDAKRNGKGARGERHGFAKLTDDSVLAARALHSIGLTTTGIASIFGVTAPTMASALAGKTWAHVR